MKIKITKEDILKNENKVLVCGISIDNPEGINLSNTNKLIKFVFNCGGYKDWAVYIDEEHKSFDEVRDCGNKVMPESLKNIFELEEGVEEMFRR